MSNCLVIIPTYNEAENIVDMIDMIFSLEKNFDLLVIDDSSPDGTAELVKSRLSFYKDQLFLEKRSGKQGLGTAYIYMVLNGLSKETIPTSSKWMPISLITQKTSSD